MRLESLTVENIKLLDDQTFSFGSADSNDWRLFIGENGTCKTTILRSIALLAAGPQLAVGLLPDPRTLLRQHTAGQPGRISAVFTATSASTQLGWPERISAELRIQPDRLDFGGNKGARQIAENRATQRAGFFVAGYGVGRHLPESSEARISVSELLQDRLEGLFLPHHTLLGIDFYDALGRSADDDKTASRLQLGYSQLIRDVLSTVDPSTGDALLPSVDTIELRGRSGVKKFQKLLSGRRFSYVAGPVKYLLSPSDLSQGYQSTISWICDLLGHALLDQPTIEKPSEVSGLVLLDEADLHLHPQWQRRFVPTLRALFPNVQLVTTTHSPVVVPSFEAREVTHLGLSSQGLVEQLPILDEPGLQHSTQILDEFFGLGRVGRPALVALERQYLRRRAQGATEDELADVHAALAKYLDQ